MSSPTINKRTSQDTLVAGPCKKPCTEQDTEPQVASRPLQESRFLRLPAEIRLRIYRHVLTLQAYDVPGGRHKYPVICLGPDQEKQKCNVWNSENGTHPLLLNLNLPSHLVGRTSLDPDITTKDLRKLHHQNHRYRIDNRPDWLWDNSRPYVAPRDAWYERRDVHEPAMGPSLLAGLLYCCRAIHWELLWELHRATEFWCTEPEEFVDFCVRTVSLGTASMIQSLRVDFWLWEIAPAHVVLPPGTLGFPFTPQRLPAVYTVQMESVGRPRKDGWLATLGAMESGLRGVFPGLKRLWLSFSPFEVEDFRDGRFRMGGWRYSAVEQRTVVGLEVAFLHWAFHALASTGVFCGLGEGVELRLGGVENRAVAEWMREGILGEWDRSEGRRLALIDALDEEEVQRAEEGPKRRKGRRGVVWL